MSLKGKNILVTGAGSGIGKSLSLEAARRGANLILAGRRREALEDTATAIAGLTNVIVVPCDLTELTGRAKLVAAIRDAGGRLSILVNNAGVLAVGSLATITDAEAVDMVATNILAPILLSRDVLPFLEQEEDARIVNIGSMFGEIAYPYFAAYSATKFALRGFSDALRRELTGSSVSISYAAPRATRTAAAKKFAAFIEPMNMILDDPETVAGDVWDGVEQRKCNIYPGLTERIGIAIQGLCPGLLNRYLGKFNTSKDVKNADGLGLK